MIEIIDLFAGAGGGTQGAVEALRSLGMDARITAINHWQTAIDSHKANHPEIKHLCKEIDSLSPKKVIPGGQIDFMIAAPECTHHSNARGGAPKNDQSRASAWEVVKWAEELHARRILIENVPEFKTWGPLDKSGKAIQKLKGKTFLAFIGALESLGYRVQHRVICCADYGDPTTRRRLFIMASLDGEPTWPKPTHGKQNMFEALQPYRTARDVIDLDNLGKSIFARKRPLVKSTIKRIRAGIEKFREDQQFIIRMNGTEEDQLRASSFSIGEPLPSIVASSPHLYLATPFIIPTNHGTGDMRAYSLQEPMKTITGGPKSINEPLDTVTARDRFALITPIEVNGNLYDVFFRMLTPKELSRAMSFPEDYVFMGTREDAVKQIGNAIPVRTATALCTEILSTL